MGVDWHSLSADEVRQRLSPDPGGLAPETLAERLAEYGPNELSEAPPPSIFRRLLAQFNDVTVLALIAAAVIAAVLAQLDPNATSFLERWGDATAIALIVAINAVIGFSQERRAESALRALEEGTAPLASVVRGGRELRLDARELVPGDRVLLDEGDRVPADVRLIETHDVSLSEAALTGESQAVEKQSELALAADTPLAERINMAYLGSHVVRGKATGIVVTTGMSTSLGEIAGLLDRVQVPETPLSRDLRRFGLWIVIGCVVVGLGVFAVSALQGQSDLRTAFLTAVSLAVAAIPEGLPAVTTIVLALGVQRMAARSALVRRLPAVETLGTVQVICTDKTGTLTQNRMTVRRLATLQHELEVSGAGPGPGLAHLSESGVELTDIPSDVRSALSCAAMAPAARIEQGEDGLPIVLGDPTDGALLLLDWSLSESPTPDPEVVASLAFDGRRKRASVIVPNATEARDGAGHSLWVHGAHESVVSVCSQVLRGEHPVPLESAQSEVLDRIAEEWTLSGLRVLALASRPIDPESPKETWEQNLTLVGLVGLSDPPREGVKRAIARARLAKVRTVMITGDHPNTARAIAREIGLTEGEPRVVAGSEFEKLDDDELQGVALTTDVVARATAAHKLRFVEALRARSVRVAMTGDGVNDAPALKSATIGIAMGREGTDVAREASDMILADDNYATIVAAIEEGRGIFSNIRRFILFLLSINAGLVFAVLVPAVMGWPAILTPTQILWINLITNGLPALALGMEPIRETQLSLGPRKPDSGLLQGRDVVWMAAYGTWMAVIGLYAFLQVGLTPEQLPEARSVAFTVLAIGPLFHAFTCRNRTRSIFSLGLFSNRTLLYAIAAGLGFHAVALYTPGLDRLFGTVPLGAPALGFALALSATVLIVGELEKLIGKLVRKDTEPDAD